MPREAAVVGGSGFVGSAVVAALTAAGHRVRSVPAPRLHTHSETAQGLVADASAALDATAALTEALIGVDLVVNAAGVADAATDSTALVFGANAMLPRVVREASLNAGSRRFVHVSSAGVQGRTPLLDETDAVAPFSLYTRSKALGESVLYDCPETLIFRPTSVHGPDRSISRSLVKLARSPLASVAGTGDRPTPQVLVENVGSAVAFVATYGGEVPSVVLQPWEGLTTASLIEVLGGRPPRRVPAKVARWILTAMEGSRSARVAANVRRLEMLWFGQAQVDGWLTTTTWRPPVGATGWQDLATDLTEQG